MSRFNEHGLTPQQEAFAVAVAAGSNLSDAYRKAYPRSLKWKQEYVHVKASEMASSAKVKRRISALRADAEKASTLEAARVLDEIAKLAHSDISRVWHEDGRMKLPHELDPATRAAVASFEIDAKGTIKYRFWDKNAALEKAMKHLGQYERDNNQKTDSLQSLLDTLSWNVLGVKPDNRGRERGQEKSGGEKTDDSPSDEALTPDGALSVPGSKVFGPRSGDDS